MSDAVDFLSPDKHESLLQIDTKIFWWVCSSILKVPKKASLQCLYNIPKKVRDEVDFFDVKGMVMGMIKHYQSTQSNRFAMSLKYL